MKKFFALALAIIIGCAALVFTKPLPLTAQEIHLGLAINGKVLTDAPTVIQGSLLLLPVEAIFEHMPGLIQPQQNGISIRHEESIIFITLGERDILIDGQAVEMPVEAQIINGRVMVSAGLFAMGLGFNISISDNTVWLNIPLPAAELPIIPLPTETLPPETPGPIPTAPPEITETPPLPILESAHIHYDVETRTFRMPRSFLLSQAIHQDLYHQHIYALVLPIDASAYLGFGTMPIADGLLDSLTVTQTLQGQTQLIFNSRQIIALQLQESTTHYYVQILHPREKYPRIVVIDPGDGGSAPGAIHGGVMEKDLNLAVALKLQQLLQAEGSVRVYTTRNTDVYVSLADRAPFANAVGDIYVAIHHNAAYNPEARGVETFYRPSEWDTLRPLPSQDLAALMQRHMVAHTGRRDRQHQSADFLVLRYATLPAILVEVGFMSNAQELATLVSETYQWRAAIALFHGILEAFERYTPAR